MTKKTPKSPQEKKRESYAKDRRNVYGENAKASRKGIPRKKRQQSRAERRVANAPVVVGKDLDFDRADANDAKLAKKRKEVWRLKMPDLPLGEVLARKSARRAAAGE
jgi:hypothetical protein